MHPMLNIAIRAARNAGNVITRAYEDFDKVEAEQKGLNDYVSNVDRDAERAIIAAIRKAYPDHTVIGEESGTDIGENDSYKWIIDPLDGTSNFLKRIPHFSVSVALQVNGKTEVGVVYDPMTNELFSASRGQGAQLNSQRIRVANQRELTGTLLGTGFPFKARQHTDTYMTIFGELFNDVADMRRAGSAALDLAYVACGRLDGFFEIGLKPWDFAAGELLVREAGGIVTDFTGGHKHITSGNIVAGGPKVTAGIVTKMRPHLSDALK
ncbi:inositol-1-monophosphatase [Ferrimonas lipolytica]|uniref:Inositol-1-monophosphatase n=1 Tax=Ferrimonas lipolytica TaxID=2724191 RepID=A0A6H1UF94_9GAMM|nr:inositol-1-monophosphatase [Ferrimonas lipolytica]QIZ77003.1 inositol-1-monophosphatase [Ferrimonas lipolytica]